MPSNERAVYDPQIMLEVPRSGAWRGALEWHVPLDGLAAVSGFTRICAVTLQWLMTTDGCQGADL